MKQEVIKMSVKMADPRGLFIPKNYIEELKIVIVDESAVFQFKNIKTTRKFALTAIELEKRRGVKETIYLERLQKAVTRYPGKKKEEIKEIILNQLSKMGANVKKIKWQRKL